MLVPLMHALDQSNLDKWRPFDFLAKLGEEGKERAKWALKRGVGGGLHLLTTSLDLFGKRERERDCPHEERERERESSRNALARGALLLPTLTLGGGG